MNSIHDLGGMDNIGPLNIEQDEPVFHADWERKTFALTLAVLATGACPVDEIRHMSELIPPADYLRFKYYEKWLRGLEFMLLKKNLVTDEELESGRAEAAAGGLQAAAPETLQHIMNNRLPAFVDLDLEPKFKAGDAIIAKNINPPGHTRLPRYIRGKRGEVEMDHGVFLLPDANAHGEPERPQHVYGVRFSASELWGEDAPAGDSVHIDLFDDYMNLAEQSLA